ncbi:hypothetical protein BgiBS90_029332, partial [Biomphalaria glabrata]
DISEEDRKPVVLLTFDICLLGFVKLEKKESTLTPLSCSTAKFISLILQYCKVHLPYLAILQSSSSLSCSTAKFISLILQYCK